MRKPGACVSAVPGQPWAALAWMQAPASAWEQSAARRRAGQNTPLTLTASTASPALSCTLFSTPLASCSASSRHGNVSGRHVQRQRRHSQGEAVAAAGARRAAAGRARPALPPAARQARTFWRSSAAFWTASAPSLTLPLALSRPSETCSRREGTHKIGRFQGRGSAPEGCGPRPPQWLEWKERRRSALQRACGVLAGQGCGVAGLPTAALAHPGGARVTHDDWAHRHPCSPTRPPTPHPPAAASGGQRCGSPARPACSPPCSARGWGGRGRRRPACERRGRGQPCGRSWCQPGRARWSRTAS